MCDLGYPILMNKRIKKKQLKRLQRKCMDIMEAKGLSVSVKCPSDMEFKDIIDLKKLFNEMNVDFRISDRKRKTL